MNPIASATRSDALPLEQEPAQAVCPDPACARPATIEARWTFASTDGPVEMVKVRCEAGCWYTVPASDPSPLIR